MLILTCTTVKYFTFSFSPNFEKELTFLSVPSPLLPLLAPLTDDFKRVSPWHQARECRLNRANIIHVSNLYPFAFPPGFILVFLTIWLKVEACKRCIYQSTHNHQWPTDQEQLVSHGSFSQQGQFSQGELCANLSWQSLRSGSGSSAMVPQCLLGTRCEDVAIFLCLFFLC